MHELYCRFRIPVTEILMGMKKCVVLFILLFVLPVGIFAQDYKDIIYLKDGSIVKGIISENILDWYVVVKT